MPRTPRGTLRDAVPVVSRCPHPGGLRSRRMMQFLLRRKPIPRAVPRPGWGRRGDPARREPGFSHQAMCRLARALPAKPRHRLFATAPRKFFVGRLPPVSLEGEEQREQGGGGSSGESQEGRIPRSLDRSRRAWGTEPTANRLRRVAAGAAHGHSRAGKTGAGPLTGVHLREPLSAAPYESLTLHHEFLTRRPRVVDGRGRSEK